MSIIQDPITDKESFKHYYETIIKNFNPILYDDQYMFILTGKTHTLKLLNQNTTNQEYVKRANSAFNTFDESMSSTFKEYDQLLVLSKKILKNFIDITNSKYIPYTKPLLLEIKYLLSKYYQEDKQVLLIASNDYIYTESEFKRDMSNLKQVKSIIVTSDTLLDAIKEGPNGQVTSMIIYANKALGYYKYYTNTETFIAIYNKIIKLSKGNYTISLKIKSDYYIELIFDIIDLLRKYFKNVYLVNTKYNRRYNFVIVLKEKIKDYDNTDNIEFSLDLCRLFKNPLDASYVDYMNKLYAEYTERIKTFMAIEALQEKEHSDYELVMERINNYKSLQN